MQETQEMRVPSLSLEDPLEEGTAIHSSILAWRIPWTEEPGRRQSIGLQRVRYNWSDLACTCHGLTFLHCDSYSLHTFWLVLNFVLVFYFWVTGYYKLSSLKWHTVIVSWFLEASSLSMAWLDPLLRVSQGCNQDLGWAVLLSGAQGPVSFTRLSIA